MALPKRKHSRSRRDKRRANWKISFQNLSKCPQCNQLKMSHRVCPHCGYYKGKPVIILETEVKGEKKK